MPSSDMLSNRFRTLVLCACVSACAAKTAPRTKAANHAAETPPPAAQAAAQRPAEKELGPRESLPVSVRGALAVRMGRHGEQLTYLLADVVLLDFESAEQLADEIRSEPPLSRPLPGDTESLNALLPAAFFNYQDELKKQAARLGQAAKARDRAELVKAFGSVAETCVACHSAYLFDESSAAHQPEPDDI